ncbi:Mov34/MPN/PAD-1 family protein [Tsukamurella tyrosinosolvens]|nr:Mov34/MPN/PAD-1 family protein [Tsukamurella tyrosinosolvens]
MSSMTSAGIDALPYETGGILAGFRTERGIVVTRAAVVSSDNRSRAEYTLVKRRAMDELVRLRASASKVVGFVGDWHTHPADVPPSSTDIGSLRTTAKHANDVIALLVLPFVLTQPRPTHVLLGTRSRSSSRWRGRVDVRPGRLEIRPESASELEKLAEESLQMSKRNWDD